MRSSCCSSAARSFKSYNARDLAFPPIGGRFRHTAADVTQKTCSATVAKCKVGTDPAQKMCAATGVPRLAIYQHVFCRPKNNEGLSWAQKKRRIMLDLFRTRLSHRHGAFHKTKSPDLHFFLHKCTTKSSSADVCCRKPCCSWLMRPLSQICKQAATRHCRGFADL